VQNSFWERTTFVQKSVLNALGVKSDLHFSPPSSAQDQNELETQLQKVWGEKR
jgi:hypothetical protein